MVYKNKFISVRSLIVIAVLVLFIPFPTFIVPDWKVQVIDENGNVCQNREVTETWAHYSIYIGSGNFQSERRRTNSNGYVEFPERKVWAPLIWRGVGSVIAHVLIIAHGSAGPDASIYATGLKDKAWIDYETDGLVDKILVDRCIY